MPGGAKRKDINTIPVPSKSLLAELIRASAKPNPIASPKQQRTSMMERAFVAFLYLTGARVGEICKNRRIRLIDDFITADGWHVPKERFTGHDWAGLTYGQLSLKEIQFKSTNETKIVCLIENVPVEKHRGVQSYRNIPISPMKDKEFVEIVDEYVSKLKDSRQVLFPFLRQRGFLAVKKIHPDWFPHALRHFRLTHLAVDDDYSDLELKQLTGWSDTRPAAIYTHLSWHNLVKKHF